MLDIRPVTPVIGAQIHGVDLSTELAPGPLADIRAALAKHHVLFFRDQFLSVAAQKKLTEAFGPLLQLPYIEPMQGEPSVIRVLKEADEGGGVFGGEWHQDFSFLAQPPAGSILCAVDVPACGGDTLWISQTAVWETLPEPLKPILRGRNAMHVGKPYGVKWAPPMEERSGASIRMSRGDPAADVEQSHPAVIRHPDTGREAIFLNPQYVCRLDGMTEAQSAPLLQQIQQHAMRPEFTCRFRWTPGAVAIWDNLFTQHFAVNDYLGARREMHRTTFSGPEPGELAVQ
jgi:taurine dioxygenase